MNPARPPAAAAPAPAARKIVAPIKVTVVPSPAAKQRLAQAGESIVVEAVYGGDPVPGSSAATNALGMIELGTAVEELPAEGGTVGFSDSLVDRENWPPSQASHKSCSTSIPRRRRKRKTCFPVSSIGIRSRPPPAFRPCRSHAMCAQSEAATVLRRSQAARRARAYCTRRRR